MAFYQDRAQTSSLRPGPVFSPELSGTPYQQIKLSFIIIINPNGERFSIGKDPQGRETYFSKSLRNLEEEERAMPAVMAPGQVRQGLRFIGRFFPCWRIS
jgi:hypothetical protein